MVSALIGIPIVIAALAGFYFVSQPAEKFEPLVEIQSDSISPQPANFFDDVTQIKPDETATITIEVVSLSNEYNNNAKLTAEFLDKEAYDFFQVLDSEKNVGVLQQAGADSGTIQFTVKGIKSAGKYENTLSIKLTIDGIQQDDASFKIRIAE